MDRKAAGLLGAISRWAKEPPAGERFFSKVRGDPGACWKWNRFLFRTGYGQCKFRGKTMGAHRVAWMLARGPIPDGLFVLHRCDNRSCVNPSHLFLGTQKDNISDAWKKGRISTQTMRRTKKLSGKDVEQIRKSLAKGGWGIQTALARRFGVNQSTISDIKYGKLH